MGSTIMRLGVSLVTLGGIAAVAATMAVEDVLFGNASLVDGALLGDGVVTVVDGHVACFLAPTDTGFVLVDACASAHPIAKALRDRGATLEDLHAVFLTHSHSDHLGGVSSIAGSVPVYALKEEGWHLRGNPHTGPITQFLPGSRPAHAITYVSSGDQLLVDGLTIGVYALPGHTRGSAVYTARSVAFLGDGAMTRANGELEPAPWVFSEDVRQSENSLHALALALVDSDITQIAPAHTAAAPISALTAR